MPQSSEIIDANSGNGIHRVGNVTNGAEKVSAWQQPGPAAFDFRSKFLRVPLQGLVVLILN
jgi:hypothetical protein